MKNILLKLNMAIVFIVVLFANIFSTSYAKTINYAEIISKIEKNAVSLKYESLPYQGISKDLNVLTVTYNENKLQQIADEYDGISSIVVQNGAILFKNGDKNEISINLSIMYSDSKGNIKYGPYKSEKDDGAYYTYVENKVNTITFADAAQQYYDDQLKGSVDAQNIVIKYEDNNNTEIKKSNVYITSKKTLSFNSSDSEEAKFDGTIVYLEIGDISVIASKKERRKELVYGTKFRVLFCRW